MRTIPAINLLLDSNRGIYIPRDFAEIYREGSTDGNWQGAASTDIDTLLEGPDSEWYWDAWAAVLDDAIFTLSNGTNDPTVQEFTLDQSDGDLWAICADLMDPTEYRDFYGDDPDRDWWTQYADRHDLDCYTLPEHWASALINGDTSGMEDQDESDMLDFTSDLGFCVDVSEPWFATHNDASLLGGDVAIFLFRRIES